MQKKYFKNLLSRSLFSDKIIILFFLSVLLSGVLVFSLDVLPRHLQEGDIAKNDVIADQNYEIVDKLATDKIKAEVIAKILPVYDWDIHLVNDRRQNIKEAFLLGRSKIFSSDATNQTVKVIEISVAEEQQLQEEFFAKLGLSLDQNTYQFIRKEKFSDSLEESLLNLFTSLQRRQIINDKTDLNFHQSVTIRQIGTSWQTTARQHPQEFVLTNFNDILTLNQAKQYYDKRSVAELQRDFHLEFSDKNILQIALKIVPQLVRVNLLVNKIEFEKRRENAGNSVQNVITKLKKGQIIIRRGDRFDSWHINIIEGIQKTRLQTNAWLKFLGMFILFMMSLGIVYHFAKSHFKSFQVNQKDIIFLSLLLLFYLVVLRFGSFAATTFQLALPFNADVGAFYYLIPIAAGSMMVSYILNSQTAFIFSVLLSVFSGLFLQNSLEANIYYLLSGIYAAHAVKNAARRSSIIRAGIYTGIVNVLVVLGLNLMNVISMAFNSVSLNHLFIEILFGFSGGIFSALFMLAISPLFETIFNYTTNIQLLELANMNHPLLRQMIVRAPGTYHHSQLVGILAEAATQEIGANSLLARVASYYHDIGKMKKPIYFIENQKGDNPHDRLAPSLSALIIEAHVRDGLEIAKEHKLPKVIADIIPEHQGTKLIGYFYQKAQKLADPEKTKIDEKDFRYKGPKPQSKESGVIMLADTIEAAVRSMPDKTPQKIQALVEKLVNYHFSDGQLDECDLTLKDLHLVIEAFVKILIGIYHQRVEYPKMNQPKMVLVKNEKTTSLYSQQK